MGSIKNLLITIVSLTSLLQCTTHAFVQSPSPSPSSSQSLLLNPNNILGAASNTVDILEYCQDTENPALCAETIAPSLDGTFDPIKALETEMEATFAQSKKVAKIISEALRNPNTDPRAHGALSICKSQYKSIMETVNDAVELLNQQNVVDAYYKFSSVLSDQSTCEDAFVESPGVTIPFSDESHTVYQLGGNCLAIMEGMVNNRNRFILV
ncbi:hypothetical protein V8G54_018978 [Vigna mungo]|uniref:Pectinesterase inhibitor domain-containing protein n=1 Tax=Vigna mungo TaxID=3915 RepID=A0AAQ3NAK3_VIGMU